MADQTVGIKALFDGTAAVKGIKNVSDSIKATEKAAKSQSSATGGILRLQKNVSGLINTYAAAAAGAIAAGAAAMKMVNDYAAAEAVQIRLERSVKNAGLTYSSYDKRIQEVIASQSMLAAVDDEEVATSLATLVQATGDVNTALQLNQLALDLSRAKGKDLASTATVIGKVYKGNVGALKKYGVTVKEGATATEALGELQKMYAGYAEDYGNSTAGAADRMATAWGNASEAGGEFLVDTLHADRVLNDVASTVESVSKGDWGSVFKNWTLAAPAAAMLKYSKEVEKTNEVHRESGIVIAGVRQQYEQYTAAIDENRTAQNEEMDAELAKLRADEQVAQKQKELTDLKKSGKASSRDLRIAELELKTAQREAGNAAKFLADKQAEAKSAGDRLAKNSALLDYLKKLRDILRQGGDAAAVAGRRINAIQNPGTNSGGVRAYASGGWAAGPTSGYPATLHGTELVTSFDPAYRRENQKNLLTAAQKLGMSMASSAPSSAPIININVGSQQEGNALRAMVRQELARVYS